MKKNIFERAWVIEVPILLYFLQNEANIGENVSNSHWLLISIFCNPVNSDIWIFFILFDIDLRYIIPALVLNTSSEGYMLMVQVSFISVSTVCHFNLLLDKATKNLINRFTTFLEKIRSTRQESFLNPHDPCMALSLSSQLIDND